MKENFKVEEVTKQEAPTNIRFEIVKSNSNIVLRKGKISKRKAFKDARIDGMPRRYYANKILKESWEDGNGRERSRFVVRWQVATSEAEGKDGNVQYDPSLEMMKAADYVTQMRDAVGRLAGSFFNNLRVFMPLLILCFLLGIPIGLPVNSIFHWVGNVEVRWVP